MGERKVEVEINGTVSEELSASLAAALREVEAASAMLAALRACHDVLMMNPHTNAGRAHKMAAVAIAQAEEAGIE